MNNLTTIRAPRATEGPCQVLNEPLTFGPLAFNRFSDRCFPQKTPDFPPVSSNFLQAERTLKPRPARPFPESLRFETRTFETDIQDDRFFSTWSSLRIDQKTYEEIGPIIAWRASLWRDGQKLAEQESFLW